MRWCLFLEWTGLCQGAWVVALLHRRLVKFKRDEVYIGTAEERAAKKQLKKEASIAAGDDLVSSDKLADALIGDGFLEDLI